MPTTPARPCRHPACPALVHGGNGLCPAHQDDAKASQRAYEATRVDNESTRIRRGSRWRKLSELVRAQNPLCCDPYRTHEQEGSLAYSAQVHHILGADEHPELIFDMGNLAAVCTRCHARLEAEAKRGVDNAALFVGKTAQDNAPTVFFA